MLEVSKDHTEAKVSLCCLEQGPHYKGKLAKNLPVRETRGIDKVCQNTGNLYARVLISLILKIKDIAKFSTTFSYFFLKTHCICLVSFSCMQQLQFTEVGTGTICGGKNREFESEILVGTLLGAEGHESRQSGQIAG